MVRVKVNINQLYFGKDNNQDTFHKATSVNLSEV